MNKKSLLTTTALVSLFATSAFADVMHPHEKGLEVKFGGEAQAQAGASFQDDKYKKDINMSPNNKYVAFDTEAYLYLEAKGKTTHNLVYGAHVGISPTIAYNANSAQHYPNRTYLFLEDHNLGRLELGSNEGAGDMFTLGAGSIAAATGGVNGDWFKYVQTASTTVPGDFVLNPALPLDNDLTVDVSGNRTFAGQEKARKITYLTPSYEGFRAGISYIPDVNHSGSITRLPSTSNPTLQENDAVSGGLMWEGKFQKDHTLKLSLVGEWGKVKPSTIIIRDSDGKVMSNNKYEVKDTLAGIVGGTWQYKHFLAAASFGWLGKSDYFKSATNMKNSWFATLGFGAEWDKFLGTVTGMYSNRNANKAYIISGGVDYNLAPGFLPFAELTYVNLKGSNTGGVNRTSVAPESVSEALNSNTLFPGSSTVSKYSGENSGKSQGLAFILGTKVKF